ncbi:MAG: phosphotransferase family protein [Myxococcota bacterium]
MSQFTEPHARSVDVDALARFLDSAGLPGEGERPTLRALGGGSQNELWLVERGGARMVLRKPPATAVADRVEGMRREHRLARALEGSDVPHPRYLAGSDDPSILGMPFFLMEAIDGWSPVAGGRWESPYDVDLAARHGIGLELARGAASMARFDWRARGLEGFGRPENFHARQVDRWLAFHARIRCRDLPGLDEAAAWLRGHVPRHFKPGLMHGDYQMANVMFAHGTPTNLLAIIDWEMATIGDPLLDLGWVLVAWGPEAADMQHAGFMQAPGLPTRDEMLEHYERCGGPSTGSIDYYVVLARWKLGIVLEQSYSRLLQGAGVNPRVEFFGKLVPELIRKAASLAASIG